MIMVVIMCILKKKTGEQGAPRTPRAIPRAQGEGLVSEIRSLSTSLKSWSEWSRLGRWCLGGKGAGEEVEGSGARRSFAPTQKPRVQLHRFSGRKGGGGGQKRWYVQSQPRAQWEQSRGWRLPGVMLSLDGTLCPSQGLRMIALGAALLVELFVSRQLLPTQACVRNCVNELLAVQVRACGC